MSRSIITSLLLAGVLAVLAWPMGSRAADMTQTITLKPGWNAVFVTVQPDQPEIAQVFSGIPVRSVWRWIPSSNSAQFIRNPEDGLQNIEGWFAWFPEPRPDAVLTNLFTVDANTAYLVRLPDDAATQQLVISGSPRYSPIAWRPNEFTLTGLPVALTNAPTFAEFFSRSPAHQAQPIFRLDNTDGRWKPVTGGTPINANEAYWFFTKGNSRYQGRMDLVLDQGESLEFGRTFDQIRFVLRNLSGTDGSFQLERIGGDQVPLSIRVEDEETHEVGWPDLPNVEVLPAPTGKDVFVTIAIKRAQFIHDRMEEMVAVTDENGQRIVLYVGGNAALAGALSRPARDGTQPKAGGDNPVALAGLWIGTVKINKVSEAQQAGTEPKSVGQSFDQRVLIHVNAQGQARLLKDVIQMWEDGTMQPSAVDPTYSEVATPGRYVLLTNKNLIGLYSGVAGRDGKAVGLRYSTVAYDFDGELLDFAGVFGPGGALSTTMVVSPTLPTNPFLHRYHPDHDNKDEHFLNYQEEAYQVVRNMQFIFTTDDPDAPAGVTQPGWGDSTLGGTFNESITGLHRNTIFTSGTFRLQRASTVTVLNQ